MYVCVSRRARNPYVRNRRAEFGDVFWALSSVFSGLVCVCGGRLTSFVHFWGVVEVKIEIFVGEKCAFRLGEFREGRFSQFLGDEIIPMNFARVCV